MHISPKPQNPKTPRIDNLNFRKSLNIEITSKMYQYNEALSLRTFSPMVTCPLVFIFRKFRLPILQEDFRLRNDPLHGRTLCNFPNTGGIPLDSLRDRAHMESISW